jgi:Lon protease-like protein
MAAPLAIFPLDVVLFPGALLPLHIFEPRYRQLLADCLDQSRPFGLVQPAPDGQRPPPGGVGALAQVQHHEQLADGRSHIIVLGSGRFRLERYQDSDRLYSVAEPSPISDSPDSAPDPGRLAELRQLADRYRELTGALHDIAPGPAAWSQDPELVSFQIAAAFELTRSTQWRLLSLERTDTRVQRLHELGPSLLDELAIRAAVHLGAQGNGKGHHTSPPNFG